MNETDFHRNGNGRTPHALGEARSVDPSPEAEPLRPERGRVFFSTAWMRALIDGLISEEEFLARLADHSHAENVRTIPGIPWRHGRVNKQIGTR